MFGVVPGSLADVAVGDLVTVSGSEGRHAVRVRRMAPGEPVQVSDGSGVVAHGVVDTTEGDELVVSVREVGRPESGGPRLVLVQALAKGGRDEQAIEAATELGVDIIVPWAARHSVVQWRGDRAERAHRKWESVVAAAAKQARRAVVPVVERLADISDVVALTGGARVLVLHESAEARLSEVIRTDLPAVGRVVLVVGPEGGVAPEELTALTAAGATAVRLGPTVLRSSTAGPAAIAVLSAQLRW